MVKSIFWRILLGNIQRKLLDPFTVIFAVSKSCLPYCLQLLKVYCMINHFNILLSSFPVSGLNLVSIFGLVLCATHFANCFSGFNLATNTNCKSDLLSTDREQKKQWRTETIDETYKVKSMITIEKHPQDEANVSRLVVVSVGHILGFRNTAYHIMAYFCNIPTFNKRHHYFVKDISIIWVDDIWKLNAIFVVKLNVLISRFILQSNSHNWEWVYVCVRKTLIQFPSDIIVKTLTNKPKHGTCPQIHESSSMLRFICQSSWWC